MNGKQESNQFIKKKHEKILKNPQHFSVSHPSTEKGTQGFKTKTPVLSAIFNKENLFIPLHLFWF